MTSLDDYGGTLGFWAGLRRTNEPLVTVRGLQQRAGWKSSSPSHRAVVDRLDLREQPRDAVRRTLLRSGRRNVGEWRLVEQRRVHYALIGQVLDHHVDELDLRSRRRSRRQEFAECFADRRAVEPDQRAHEAAEALAGLARALDIPGLADAGVEQHLFEFARGRSASAACPAAACAARCDPRAPSGNAAPSA